MKVLLMADQGLYSSVWWEQPPMHPVILYTGAILLGSEVHVFRLVAVLLFAASLGVLMACVSPLRQRGLAKLILLVLCVSSMSFLSYGLSVTIMLPALGFALWAVWLWQRDERGVVETERIRAALGGGELLQCLEADDGFDADRAPKQLLAEAAFKVLAYTLRR